MPEDWYSYILLFIILILLVWFYTRRGKPGFHNTAQTQLVTNVISNLNENMKIFQKHRTNKQSTKKFMIINWAKYKEKFDFVSPQSVSSLDTAYNLMSEFNEKMDVSLRKRNKDLLLDMSIETLREPLYKGRQGLVQWLNEYIQKETFDKRGGSSGR